MSENIRIMQKDAPEVGRKFVRTSGYSTRLRFDKAKADALGITEALTTLANVFAAEAQKGLDAKNGHVAPSNFLAEGAAVAGIEITGVKIKVLLDVPATSCHSMFKTIAGTDAAPADGSALFNGSGSEADDGIEGDLGDGSDGPPDEFACDNMDNMPEVSIAPAEDEEEED